MTATAFSPEARAHRAWQSGQALMKRGLLGEAAGRLQQAHRMRPLDKLYKITLAQVLLKLEKSDEAIELLQQTVAQDPSDGTVLGILIQCLQLTRRDDDLVTALRQVPDERMTRERFFILGEAQIRLGRPVDAIHTWLKALKLDITDTAVHVRLGYAFYDLNLRKEACECLQTALALGLGDSEGVIHDLLAFYARQACDWEVAGRQVQALHDSLAGIDDSTAVQTAPFCHAVLLDDPALLLKAARSQSRFVQRGMTPMPARLLVSRDRIRVGYLSSDFHYHATAMLMAQMFERHDRSRFEIFLYSHGIDDGSDLRQRLRDHAEHFVDLHGQSVPEMSQRIRDDGIDILVDLKGYTRDARPHVLAARPAPVQVSYLGFPGTLGADFVDYIVGDPWITPHDSAHLYSEKIANVSSCYQCNDGTRKEPDPPPRTSLGLPEEALVLCNFNQFYKISADVFDVWCRILDRLPHAVLWLLRNSEDGVRALTKEAQARGIDPGRLIFAPQLKFEQHLDRLACADLAIDCWPCNGHTTTSDALWAGVPVVTYSGRSFASRVAGSLLRAVDAAELVTTSVQDYENKVVALGQDMKRLAGWKTHLSAQRSVSTLFHAETVTREIECLYEKMWDRALAGLPPDHLSV